MLHGIGFNTRINFKHTEAAVGGIGSVQPSGSAKTKRSVTIKLHFGNVRFLDCKHSPDPNSFRVILENDAVIEEHKNLRLNFGLNNLDCSAKPR